MSRDETIYSETRRTLAQVSTILAERRTDNLLDDGPVDETIDGEVAAPPDGGRRDELLGLLSIASALRTNASALPNSLQEFVG